MFRLFFSILLLLLTVATHAQQSITREANLFRSGDKLCKIVIDYVNPGECGLDNIWTLGRATGDSPEIIQTILFSNDTIAILESDRICHYLMRRDTLVNKGMQNRRSYCMLEQERPVMRYPFQFGDSIEGSYCGQGKYENMDISCSGWGYSVVDGLGVITDGIDTLQHITRVRICDEYEMKFSESSILYLQSVLYQWYSLGSRYPIMESQCTMLLIDTLYYPIDSVSYLYLPVMQKELAEDVVNDSILQEIYLHEEKEDKDASESVLSSIQATLERDGMSVNVSYCLESAVDVSMIASDILGNVIGYSFHEKQGIGDQHEQIILSRHPVGNILMLNLRCGNEQIILKIYK